MAGRKKPRGAGIVRDSHPGYRATPAGAAALLAELEADPGLRARVAALLGIPAGLPEALQALVAEIREGRLAAERRFEAIDQRFEAIDRRFEAIDRRFEVIDQRFEAIDRRFKAIDRRFEAIDRRFEAIDRRFEELRADMNARFEMIAKQLERQGNRIEEAFRRIEAMGTRWGLRTEAAFREGLRSVVGRRFGVEIGKWEHEDTDGLVFGHPARVELDVAIRDGETAVVEIKAHAGRADVAEFARSADLYDKLHGVRSRRVLISPSVDPRALDLAAKLGIEISTDLSG